MKSLILPLLFAFTTASAQDLQPVKDAGPYVD